MTHICVFEKVSAILHSLNALSAPSHVTRSQARSARINDDSTLNMNSARALTQNPASNNRYAKQKNTVLLTHLFAHRTQSRPSANQIYTYARAFALILSLLYVPSSFAAPPSPPKTWDVGVGFTAYSIPDYHGSKHSTRIFTPHPYLAYHGKFIKLNDGKVSGTLFSSPQWFLNISADGSPPINSDDNPARNGMPDLDPVLEIGPSIEYYFHKKTSDRPKLYLEFPFRAGIATSLSRVDSIGWISNPRLKYEINLQQWKLRFGVGPSFATRAFYNYYYGISTQFATEARAAYKSRGGYGGMRYSVGFRRPINDFLFGGYLRVSDLTGARFKSSPLVETKRSVLAGLSITWIFY
ncbi:MAG: hypothetical protein COB04_02015 [Gammaproteobacteria bacterium]|nr:MAG: hypothetical protein COB04_02015 [Gammaproteobacteria bacterium]